MDSCFQDMGVIKSLARFVLRFPNPPVKKYLNKRADPRLSRSVTMFQNRSANLFPEKFLPKSVILFQKNTVNMFRVSNARTYQSSIANLFQGKSVIMFLVSIV